MKLKAELKKRLIRANCAIEKALWLDDQNKAEFAGSMIPYLFQLFA